LLLKANEHVGHGFAVPVDGDRFQLQRFTRDNASRRWRYRNARDVLRRERGRQSRHREGRDER
jgi:hypothetical protein